MYPYSGWVSSKEGETRANLMYEGKEPSVSDNLIIDVLVLLKCQCNPSLD